VVDALDYVSRLLLDLTLMLLIAGTCSIIFSRIRMPPVIGYLAAGIILGPTILTDVSVDPTTINLLSNMGIVLLMFSIGLNLNLEKLKQLGSYILILLSLEMPFMVVAGYLAGLALGLDSVAAIFLGAVISGTSTAVVVMVLQGRADVDSEVKVTSTTITVMEDLGQVMILTMAAPLLVGDTPALGSIALMVISIVIFMGASLVLGSKVIPRLLNWIGRKYDPEVLLIISLGLCFAMALLSSLIGLSIAIGAFIMGLIVSQAIRANEVMEKVGPMKEVFMAVFFISIGIQVVPIAIIENLFLVFAIAFVFMVAKTIGVTFGSYLLRGNLRNSFLIATSLLAMGEFAFIIAKTALDAGVVDQQFYASVIGAALVTMLVMPIVSKAAAKAYSAMSAMTPQPLKVVMSRFDNLRIEIGNRATSTPEVRRGIKWELVLVFIDLLTIVVIQTLFYSVVVPMDPFPGMADGSDMMATLITISISMMLMLPAVINMFQGIKRIARLLADGSATGMQTKRRMHLYLTFRNLGEVAALLLLILLFLPFLAETIGVPGSIWAGIATLAVVLIAMTIRSYYGAKHPKDVVSESDVNTNAENDGEGSGPGGI
jgi:CPA2 family monovalent cation:H+ antiporter-2